MDINVNVKYEALLDNLLMKYPCFYFLKNQTLKHSDKRKWHLEREDRLIYCLEVIFIGKTGYGKSTTVNHILGQQIFESSDIDSCTRECQSAMFQIHNSTDLYYFSLADLPGIGESIALDRKYIELYSEYLKLSDTVVYLLRADQRDFAVDQDTFSRLFATKKQRNKVIIALNSVDKIEPINRSKPFKPSQAQLENANKKMKIISDCFGISEDKILYYSATEEYNLDSLMKAIAQNLKARIDKWA
jgi:small GTP-binding protein